MNSSDIPARKSSHGEIGTYHFYQHLRENYIIIAMNRCVSRTERTITMLRPEWFCVVLQTFTTEISIISTAASRYSKGSYKRNVCIFKSLLPSLRHARKQFPLAQLEACAGTSSVHKCQRGSEAER